MGDACAPGTCVGKSQPFFSVYDKTTAFGLASARRKRQLKMHRVLIAKDDARVVEDIRICGRLGKSRAGKRHERHE